MGLTQVANTVFYREALEDFPEAAFVKFLLRSPVVEKRYYAGELRHQVLEQLYAVVGGTPRFLDQVRKVLETATPGELQQEVTGFTASSAAAAGSMREQRDRYCEEVFAGRLYSYLRPESRRALSRAAVYGIAINLEGLRAVSGEELERLRSMTWEWQEYALVYPERQQGMVSELWTVYGVLRGWLLSEPRIGLEERKTAHRAAGDFLAEWERSDREKELGLSTLECLQEARSQYLAAEEYERARAMTDRLSGQLRGVGLYREVIRLNREVLERDQHPHPMNWIARAHADQSEYEEARRWYERGLSAAEALPEEAATAWTGLGMIDTATGDYPAAREKLEKSLLIYQQVDDKSGEADTWHGLGTIDLETGDHPAAREKFEKSLLIRQQIGSKAGEAASWNELGRMDLRTGDYPAAREKYVKSLLIFQQTGYKAGEAGGWNGLGTIDLRTGDYPAAREKFNKALLIRQQIGDKAGEAGSWHQLASIDLNTGDYPAAREKYERSLLISQQVGNKRGEAAGFFQLAQLALQMTRSHRFVALLAICYLLDRDIGHRDTDSDLEALKQAAALFGISLETVPSLVESAEQAYRQDRGWALIAAAFEVK